MRTYKKCSICGNMIFKHCQETEKHAFIKKQAVLNWRKWSPHCCYWCLEICTFVSCGHFTGLLFIWNTNRFLESNREFIVSVWGLCFYSFWLETKRLSCCSKAAFHFPEPSTMPWASACFPTETEGLVGIAEWSFCLARMTCPSCTSHVLCWHQWLLSYLE